MKTICKLIVAAALVLAAVSTASAIPLTNSTLKAVVK